MTFRQEEHELEKMLDLSPLLILETIHPEPRAPIAVLPIVRENVAHSIQQLKTTHSRIAVSLKKLHQVRAKVFEKRVIVSVATLIVMGMYYDYILAALKLASLPYFSYMDYKNTLVNGTSCAELFPIGDDTCDYLNPLYDDGKSWVMSCLRLLDGVRYHALKEKYNHFVAINCLNLLPAINFGDVPTLLQDKFNCASFYDVDNNMNRCPSLFNFANSSDYAVFRKSDEGICWQLGSQIFRAAHDFVSFSWDFYLKRPSTTCLRQLPFSSLNLSLSVENIYNRYPLIKPCYNQIVDSFDTCDNSGPWASFNRVLGIIFLVLAGLLLLAVTIKLAKHLLCDAFFRVRIGDLPAKDQHIILADQEELKSEKPFVNLNSEKSLTETSELLQQNKTEMGRKMSNIKAFLWPKENSLAANFLWRAGRDPVDKIVRYVDLPGYV